MLVCSFSRTSVVFFVLLSRSSVSSFFFFLMIRRPPRSTLDRSSAASDVYKRQGYVGEQVVAVHVGGRKRRLDAGRVGIGVDRIAGALSLIHISEPTRPY